MEINKEQKALLLTYKDFNNFNDKAIRGYKFKKVIIPIEYIETFEETELYRKLLPNITVGGIVIVKFIGLVLNPKEIAEKYIYGNHNILTDSQKIKYMTSDITNYVNNINQRNNKKFSDNEESDFLTQYPLKMKNVFLNNTPGINKNLFTITFDEDLINNYTDIKVNSLYKTIEFNYFKEIKDFSIITNKLILYTENVIDNKFCIKCNNIFKLNLKKILSSSEDFNYNIDKGFKFNCNNYEIENINSKYDKGIAYIIINNKIIKFKEV